MPKDSRKFTEILDTEYKCGPHRFITKNIDSFEAHLREKGHYQHLTNIQCFYCDEMIDEGGIEYKHVIDGKAMHKSCRQKMANDED